MLLPLMLLANNDCAIDGTGSMITGSRPFYWILLKEANLYYTQFKLHLSKFGISDQ